MQTVAIAGVGLIGGSFAMALRKAGFTGKILGVSSPNTVRLAIESGVIDEAPPEQEAFGQADLIYLAQPISSILDTLERIDAAARPGALVTDAGSTKVEIVRRAARSIRKTVFLGGHPMAGKETRGVSSADPDLFRGRTYFLTPQPFSLMESPAAKDFREWIERIGANPVPISPEEHDRLVAFTSHLPQLVSTALAASLASSIDPSQARLGAGPGLHDTTRLALSSYDIWADILRTNHSLIAQALDAYIAQIREIRASLGEPSARNHFEIAENFTKLLRKRSI
jgi:prephenate dehydrogenase